MFMGLKCNENNLKSNFIFYYYNYCNCHCQVSMHIEIHATVFLSNSHRFDDSHIPSLGTQ